MTRRKDSVDVNEEARLKDIAANIVRLGRQFPNDDLRNSLGSKDMLEMVKFYHEYKSLLPAYELFTRSMDEFHEKGR